MPIGPAADVMSDDVVLDLYKRVIRLIINAKAPRKIHWVVVDVTSIQEDVVCRGAIVPQWPLEFVGVGSAVFHHDRITDEEIVVGDTAGALLQTVTRRIGGDIAAHSSGTGVIKFDVDVVVEYGCLCPRDGGVPSVVIEEVFLEEEIGNALYIETPRMCRGVVGVDNDIAAQGYARA